MPVILCVIIAAALALIVGVVTRYLTITNLKNNAESKIGNAEAKAREIIDDAVKTAETTKKEALLEVKEESIRTKNDLEKRRKKEGRNCSAMKSVCWQRRSSRQTFRSY